LRGLVDLSFGVPSVGNPPGSKPIYAKGEEANRGDGEYG